MSTNMSDLVIGLASVLCALSIVYLGWTIGVLPHLIKQKLDDIEYRVTWLQHVETAGDGSDYNKMMDRGDEACRSKPKPKSKSRRIERASVI